MPWSSCCGAKVAVDGQASCRCRAGVVALVVMVSLPSMRRHLCRRPDGGVSLVAMASLPSPMLRRLSVVDNDGNGATGNNDNDDDKDDDDGATGNDDNYDQDGATDDKVD